MIDICMNLKNELTKYGADLIGIGDLYLIPNETRQNMPYGVSVAVAYEHDIIKGISEIPTKEYYEAFKNLNNKLDMIVSKGAEYLQNLGYEAYPQTTSIVALNKTDYSTLLPHKTVATRAGLGWIGKSALLITKKYGGAIRISAILTNAPLNPDMPIDQSECGDCMICKSACPAGAISGCNWNIHTIRNELYDAIKCRITARQRVYEAFGIEVIQCGKCINVCPYTQRYINS